LAKGNKKTKTWKVPSRQQYMDASLLSSQIFTPAHFPKLEEALNLLKAEDEKGALAKFAEACTDADVPEEMVPDFWETIKRITPSLGGDTLGWAGGIGP
jgi:hypothetical protein